MCVCFFFLGGGGVHACVVFLGVRFCCRKQLIEGVNPSTVTKFSQKKKVFLHALAEKRHNFVTGQYDEIL